MSAVEVEIGDDVQGAARDASREGPAGGPGEGARKRREPVEIEIEREVTKRQIIQSISTIVVVILYMVFTLLRDRDAGVVVVDPDESDDWDDGQG